MTGADFRTIALSLEGVEEYSHARLPVFRVGGQEFASLASQAEGYEIWSAASRRLLCSVKIPCPVTGACLEIHTHFARIFLWLG